MSNQGIATSVRSTVGRPTRGQGLLEAFLARLRARRADLLIRNDLRSGRILDVGCGSRPYFLAHVYFAEKFGVDQVVVGPVESIQWFQLDLRSTPCLPFAEGFFGVVTMLAVAEHLSPDCFSLVLREVHRILGRAGQLIVTTPTSWTGGLLQGMAALGLVSREEIREHKHAYTLPLLRRCLAEAGFSIARVNSGYFELGANLWAVAEK